MKRLLILGVCISLLLVLAFINSLIPHEIKPLASSQKLASNIDGMLFDMDMLNSLDLEENEDQGRLINILIHEMFHTLKAMNFIDDDIPSSSAIGNYTEWHTSGKIYEQEMQNNFLLGFRNEIPKQSVDDILSKYRRSDTVENLESYIDGAYIAGVMAREFGRDKDSAWRYATLISLHFGHEDSINIAHRPDVYAVIKNFRHGRYMQIDKERLQSDISPFDVKYKSLVNNYVKYMDETFRPSFSQPKEDVIPIYMGDYSKLGEQENTQSKPRD